MPPTSQSIPQFPPHLARVLRVLPLAPLSLSLTAYARRVAKTHAGLFRRLGEHDHASFELAPTDMPFVLLLEPRGGDPKVTVTRRAPRADARIAGPLAALIGLVHGAYDGDALFFSRDLVIEGDTAAALALRNAVDDAELDLSEEIATLSGPFAAPMRRIVSFAQRRTGVCLSRPEDLAAW